ncbi:MAG TPA: hypothetical protein VFD06_00160 [Candidatus Polarisedimenticolia bacterium]|nr:hypothetical protein [Candidatus Polarisedimenticolia bacterium]
MRFGRRATGTGLLLGLLVAGGSARADAPAVADPGQIRLVVRHALDAGRLVVRVGETAFFSAPIASLRKASTGEVERLLSIPSGLQTVSVELRDGAGRIVDRRQVRAFVVPGTAAILDVVAPGAGEALRLDWRATP